VTGYRLHDWRIGVHFLTGEIDFSPLNSVQIKYGAHPFLSIEYQKLFLMEAK
jgi:hypothetical protein